MDFSASLSGLRAFSLALSATASNIANLNTEGYKPTDVRTTEDPAGGVIAQVTRSASPGVDLSKEVVDLIITKHAFRANIAVLRMQDEAAKSVIDLLG